MGTTFRVVWIKYNFHTRKCFEIVICKMAPFCLSHYWEFVSKNGSSWSSCLHLVFFFFFVIYLFIFLFRWGCWASRCCGQGMLKKPCVWPVKTRKPCPPPTSDSWIYWIHWSSKPLGIWPSLKESNMRPSSQSTSISETSLMIWWARPCFNIRLDVLS